MPSFFDKWDKITLIVVWVIACGVFLYVIEPRDQQAKTVDTKHNPTPTPAKQDDTPPEINPEEVYESDVTLPDGSNGKFKIYVLSKKYVWRSGSETIIDGLGDLSVKDGWKTSLSKELQEQIKQSPEIIVVGTADVRNDNTLRENARAGNRSRTLLNVVTEMRGTEQSAFNWNLGQWKGAGSIPYEDQRRVIFIKIVSRSQGLNIKEGVYEALKEHQSSQPVFTDLLSSYSKSKDFDIR